MIQVEKTFSPHAGQKNLYFKLLNDAIKRFLQ